MYSLINRMLWNRLLTERMGLRAEESNGFENEELLNFDRGLGRAWTQPDTTLTAHKPTVSTPNPDERP